MAASTFDERLAVHLHYYSLVDTPQYSAPETSLDGADVCLSSTVYVHLDKMVRFER